MTSTGPGPLSDVRVACFDWGGTLMSEDGPDDIAMGWWPQVEVIDGAEACLAQLAGRLPLAIATNASVSTRPLIERALARAGLDRYFVDIFCFTELGVRKSEPEFWRAVSDRLAVRAEHIAMVGDSYEQDAAFPRRFGVQGVWFNPQRAPAGDHGAVPEVAHLTQFADWVKRAA